MSEQGNFRRGRYSIYHNTQIKLYPDGAVCTVYSAPIIRERGWEEVAPRPRVPAKSPDHKADVDSVKRSKRRARAAVFDYARASQLGVFVTFTLDKNKIDRYDKDLIFKKLRYWLDNNVRRRGLAYIVVPEYHKDGALHFHGLINEALTLVDSGTVKRNGRKKPYKPRTEAERKKLIDNGAKIIYNLPEWDYGFTTAVKIGDTLIDRYKTYQYVCKYITKSEEKIGGRWYYSGGALRAPSVRCADADFNTMSCVAPPFTVQSLGVSGVSFEMTDEQIESVLSDYIIEV